MAANHLFQGGSVAAIVNRRGVAGAVHTSFALRGSAPSSSNTPFVLLPAPTTIALASGDTLSPGPRITTLTPTFQWNSVSGATGYGLYVRDVTTGALVFPNSSGTTSTPLTGTSYTIPSGYLVNNHQYRWNMTSFSGSTEGTAVSSLRYFQTPGPLLPAPTTLSMATGDDTSPGPQISTLTPTFQWNSVSGATGYGLYVRDVTTGALVFPNSSGTTSTPLTGTSYTIPSGYLVNNHQYRWNMTSFSGSTEGTAVSSLRYFQASDGTSPQPGTVLAGFDTHTYPGDAAMTWLHENTNLSWVGYYLYPAPSRNVAGEGGNSWMGHLATLSTDWTAAPIYIGEQDPAHESQDPGNSSNPSAAKGAADGNSGETNSIGLPNSTVPLLTQEGFPTGTIVYLDIETSGAQSQPELDYIAAWCAAVTGAHYSAGIYCLASAYASVAGIAPNARFWIANPTNPSPAGSPFPTMDPSGCGVPDAVAWQYQTAPTYSIAVPPTIVPSGSLQVDLDVVAAGVPNISLLNGTLSVTGSSGDDSISFTNSGGLLTLILNGATKQYNSSAVTKVSYASNGGNDAINLSGAISATLNLASGNSTVTNNDSSPVYVAAGTGKTTINATSGTTIIPANSGTGIQQLDFAAINISLGAKVVFANTSSTLGDYSHHANRTVAVVDAGGLSVASGGTLDMGDNDMILKYAPTNETVARNLVSGLLASGFDGGGFDTAGINSSEASYDANFGSGTRALGWMDNNDIGANTFDGVNTSDLNEVMIKFTYYGDSDLSGTVDATDFGLFAAGNSGYKQFGAL